MNGWSVNSEEGFAHFGHSVCFHYGDHSVNPMYRQHQYAGANSDWKRVLSSSRTNSAQNDEQGASRRFVVRVYLVAAILALAAAHYLAAFGPTHGLTDGMSRQLSVAFSVLSLGQVLGLLALEGLWRIMGSAR